MNIQPLDLSRLRVSPARQRRSLTRADDILLRPRRAAAAPCRRRSPRRVAGMRRPPIRAARARGASVILIYGAHLLRNGAALILEP